MPSLGVESTVELNRTNFHKLLFQTPGKLHQKALHPVLLTQWHKSCPCQSENQTLITWTVKMWEKCESRIFCNPGNTITRDTGGRKSQPRGEGKREIIDLCSLGRAETAENMNLMKQPKLQQRIRSRKERGWLQGERALPVSSRPSERCYQKRRQKTDQSRNQQLGENEQLRKEYVWLFCTWLMGEKRSLNLCGVRSPWVTWALQSSSIVLPEVFPSGRSKENNCFHHLLFCFQDTVIGLQLFPHPALHPRSMWPFLPPPSPAISSLSSSEQLYPKQYLALIHSCSIWLLLSATKHKIPALP